ncbi:UNVERIFIED_CONTAM: hypothetical protein HDU68_001299 [Siphonaria sp. JEL0065]|nr:hypothetical protein HDU68_001299 [Siphonaria sp. JEL0065]
MDGGYVKVHEPVQGSFPPPKESVGNFSLPKTSLSPTAILGNIFKGFISSSSGSPTSSTSSPSSSLSSLATISGSSSSSTLYQQSLPDLQTTITPKPSPYIGSVHLEKTRIRDLKVIHSTSSSSSTRVAALTSNCGKIKLFDINQSNAFSGAIANSTHEFYGYGINASSATDVPLKHVQETVCMTTPTPMTNSMNHPIANCIAVGSVSHVSIVDPRQAVVASTVKSMDEGWGVRSLAFDSRGGLAVGGGIGRVSFLDLRVGKYVDWVCLETGERKYYLVVEDERGRGDEYYGLGGSSGGMGRGVMRDAVYTLSYCPLGVRLFAAAKATKIKKTNMTDSNDSHVSKSHHTHHEAGSVVAVTLPGSVHEHSMLHSTQQKAHNNHDSPVVLPKWGRFDRPPRSSRMNLTDSKILHDTVEKEEPKRQTSL